MLLQMALASAQQVTLDSRSTLPYINRCSPTAEVALSPSGAKEPSRVLSSTERALGYTDGDSITIKDAYIGEAGTYQVGALLTSSSFANFAGCKVVGMRFAVSKSIGKTSVFMYTVEGGVASELLNASVRRTSDGWNEVRFNSAQEYTITGSENLLFGYAYNETEEMVTAQSGAMCFYKPKTANTNGTLIQKADGFYTSNLGNICVQLIVDVSSLPQLEVKLNNLLAGNKYRKAGDKVDAFLMYHNNGLADISSIRMGYCIDNGTVDYVEGTESVKTGTSGSVEKVLDIPSDLAVGSHTLTFFVDKINGEQVDRQNAPEISEVFVTYDKTLPRQKHYVEQYNSQVSYLAPYVNDGMNAFADKDNACFVNVYKAGDPLSVASSDYLDDMYAYTYPCFTIDRFYFMGEAYIAFDVNDYAQMMPDLVGQSVEMLMSEANANPSFASVNVTSSFDEATRSVAIGVSGEVVDDFRQVMGDLGLTLMLTENKVTGRQSVVKNNNVVTDSKYEHNSVLRTYLTAATGDKMNIADGKYTANYSYTLPASWKADDMRVVAVLTKYLPSVTDDNVLEADVTNATSVKLTANTNGITTVETTGDKAYAADGIYTLGGVKLDGKNLASGVYVVIKQGKAHKIMLK